MYRYITSLEEAQRINADLKLQNSYLKEALANATIRDFAYTAKKEAALKDKIENLTASNTWLKSIIDQQLKTIDNLKSDANSKMYKKLLKTRWRLQEAKKNAHLNETHDSEIRKDNPHYVRLTKSDIDLIYSLSYCMWDNEHEGIEIPPYTLVRHKDDAPGRYKMYPHNYNATLFSKDLKGLVS